MTLWHAAIQRGPSSDIDKLGKNRLVKQKPKVVVVGGGGGCSSIIFTS